VSSYRLTDKTKEKKEDIFEKNEQVAFENQATSDSCAQKLLLVKDQLNLLLMKLLIKHKLVWQTSP